MSTAPGRAELRQRYERRLQLTVPAEPARLREVALFASIPEAVRERVIAKARRYLSFLELGTGEVVIEKGDYGDSTYFIVAGAVEVTSVADDTARLRPRVAASAEAAGDALPGWVGRAGAAAPARRFKVLAEGEIFGEMSALSRYPVSATIRCIAPVRLLRIRLPGLRMLMSASPEFRRFVDSRYRERTLARHLRGVELLGGLDDAALEELRREAELVSCEPGQVIAREGEPADAFWLVRGGFVKLSLRAGASDLAVTYLREGDHAGEEALVGGATWPVTLSALDHVELVRFGRDALSRLAAEHEPIRLRLESERAERAGVRESVTRNPTASEHLQMAIETGLIHGESVLLIDLAACVRCDECVRGCADAHGGVPRLVREGLKYRNWLVPTACYQCSDPVCMLDCPTGAIRRAVGSLVVSVDADTCIGCGNCAQRCPWGNIVMVESGEPGAERGPSQLATKCDLCPERPEGPACVQMCPHDAAVRISFKDTAGVADTFAAHAGASRLDQLLKPRRPRLLAATVAAALVLLACYAIASSRGPWSPGHGAGLAVGVLAAALFVFEMLYASRRPRAWPFAGARDWLQAHLHLGGLAAVAVLVHAGLRPPSGAMGWALLSLALWTALTGMLGAALQRGVAASLSSGLRVEALYERIPELVEGLLRDADALMAGASELLSRFYASEVRPKLERPAPSWVYLLDVRAGRETSLASLRRIAQLVSPEEHAKVQDLITISIDKMELDAQRSLQWLLRHWLLLHVPAACLLAGLLALHVLAFFLY